jgi:hypothetical protein
MLHIRGTPGFTESVSQRHTIPDDMPDPLSLEELSQTFSALLDPNSFDTIADHLCRWYDYYFETISTPLELVLKYILPFCFGGSARPSAVDLLMRILSSKNGTDLKRSLIGCNFHDELLARLPSPSACRLLTILLHDKDSLIKNWSLTPEVDLLARISEYLQSPTEPVLHLFARCPYDQRTEGQLTTVLHHLAGLIMTIPEWFTVGLNVYVAKVEELPCLAQIFFTHERFLSFLPEINLSSPLNLAWFLWFLERCWFHCLSDVGDQQMPEQRIVILEWILGPLASESSMVVQFACQAVEAIVLGQETLAFCLSRNYWGLLMGLLEQYDEFETKAWIVGAICALVRESNFDQVLALIDQGFLDIIDAYIEGVAFTIPFPLIDALQTCERHAELEIRPELIEHIFTPKIIECLQQLEKASAFLGQRNDLTVGMMVEALLGRF